MGQFLQGWTTDDLNKAEVEATKANSLEEAATVLHEKTGLGKSICTDWAKSFYKGPVLAAIAKDGVTHNKRLFGRKHDQPSC